MTDLTSVEICAGAGGTAVGLEQAGFDHVVLVENDHHACNTLRKNRPHWSVIEGDVHAFSAKRHKGVTLFSGGVPCPPFSKAGKQLGKDDERDLFPQALRLIEECQPRAVLLENVRGILDPIFDKYRAAISRTLEDLGYWCEWQLLNASDFGVPQLRPRVVLVGLKKKYARFFSWPKPGEVSAPTVGEVLYEEMKSLGWPLADEWRAKANQIAPTLVGGSKKHGGPDLGPTRAKRAWRELGVDGLGLADAPPTPGFKGLPRLTVKMAALIQGFPPDWEFAGKKTNTYRQVGNAFPPPVARAVGAQIRRAIEMAEKQASPRRKAPADLVSDGQLSLKV